MERPLGDERCEAQAEGGAEGGAGHVADQVEVAREARRQVGLPRFEDQRKRRGA
jgi:hypothetical protein